MLHELFITHCTNGTWIINPFTFRQFLYMVIEGDRGIWLFPYMVMEGNEGILFSTTINTIDVAVVLELVLYRSSFDFNPTVLFV